MSMTDIIDQRAHENLGEATAILGELVGLRVVRGEPLSPRLLRWYLDALEIKQMIATEEAGLPDDGLTEQIQHVRHRIRLAMS